MSAQAVRLQLHGWRWMFLLLMAGGVTASFLAARLGQGSTTRLSDETPWGLCLGLNVFCGIALAAGALTIASVSLVIAGPDWRAVGRASLLAGSLSYVVAILGMVANEAGNRYWQTLVGGWTSRSILSGAVWTLLLIALLLIVEFSPRDAVQLRRSRLFGILCRLELPLLILVTVVAVIHQLGLQRLISLSQTRFSPLWASPSLFLLFCLSSLALALAVLLLASWRSQVAFGKALPQSLQSALVRGLTALVFVYLLIRLMDLAERGLFSSVFSATREGLLMLLEIALLLVGMIWMHGNEANPREMFPASALIIAGVIANRLNTAITALEAGTGQNYLPRWGEFLISYSLIAAGVAGFAFGVKHLSVFEAVNPSTIE
jgi:hypothetical protein